MNANALIEGREISLGGRSNIEPSSEVGAFGPFLPTHFEDVSEICEDRGMLHQRGREAHCVAASAEETPCNESVDMVIVGQASPTFEGRWVLERANANHCHKPYLY